MRLVAEGDTVTSTRVTPHLGSYAHRNQPPLRIRRRFGNDVDDTIDCIGTPQRGAGTSDHFYSFNILQQLILNLPVHP